MKVVDQSTVDDVRPTALLLGGGERSGVGPVLFAKNSVSRLVLRQSSYTYASTADTVFNSQSGSVAAFALILLHDGAINVDDRSYLR